jgi:hypothetical protein
VRRAAQILGLLADEHRRRVVAALMLGARTADEVRLATLLTPEGAARALTRLVSAGLVEEDGAGGYVLREDEFDLAAREANEAAARQPPDDGLDGEDPERARVLRRFIRDGRLTHIPTTRTTRLVVLQFLAERFEPGRVYDEREVNALVGELHPDHASLRRYLVDEGLLARESGRYWRSLPDEPLPGRPASPRQ